MKRGGVLFEVLAAVAILVGSGSVILAAADRGERELRQSRDHARAADLARSVISAIEAGIITPQNAPAAVRSEGSGAAWLTVDADSGLPETAAGEGRWRVEVDSEPTAWAGLSKVSVHVFDGRSSTRGAETPTPAYSLSQVVRLTPAGTDSAGEAAVKGPQSKPKAPGRPRGGAK